MYKLLAVAKPADVDIWNASNGLTVTDGFYKINSSGALVSSAHRHRYTEVFIRLDANTSYYILGASAVALYSAPNEASFVSYLTTEETTVPFAFNSGASGLFMRMVGRYDLPAGQPVDRDHYYLVVSNTIPNFEKTWVELDFGEDLPAMNYQSNDVSELADRQVTYSRSLALPFTSTNVQFFKHANVLASTSERPYNKYECRLFASDRLVAGKASQLLLLNTTSTFNVQILSGARDFLDLLESTNMSAFDLGFFQRENTSLNPTNFDATNGEEFALATFTKGGIAKTDFSVHSLLPFYRDEIVITKMLAHLGYTWVHNLADEYANWTKLALPIVSLIPTAGSFTPFLAEAANVTAISLPVTGLDSGYKCNYAPEYLPILANGKPAIYSEGGLGSYITGDGDLWDNHGLEYTALFDCTLRVHYEQQNADPFTYRPQTTLQVTIIASLGDESITLFNSAPRPPQYAACSYTGLVQLRKGDTVRVRVWANDCAIWPAPTQYITNFKALVDFYDFSAETVPVGGNVYASGNLGYETMADYFKTVLQKFGLTMFVDHDTSTVYTYTMKKVYDNLSNAIDWSSKLHVDGASELSFTFGKYGQKNNVLLKDNSDDSLVDKKGFFLISNRTLESTKDLFTLDLKAGKNNIIRYDADDPNGTVLPSTLALNVPVFTYDDMAEEYTFSEGKPQQALLSSETVSVITLAGTYAWHVARAVSAQNFIDNFYTDLISKMLVNAKVTEEYFYLTPEDIEAFNPMIPVYVSQLGAYFYVNKIIDFVEGNLTKVQLIKL